jgi:uncharacterized protein (TIGR02996 family)
MARDSFPEHLIPQREAFLQSVCEEPEDLATRLIFADWLEDHGDPDRAEFIRIQCELVAELDDSPRLRKLQAREADLLFLHRRRWNGELHRLLSRTPLANQVDSRRGLIRTWGYGRGFVETIWMQALAFVRNPDVVFRIGPIKSLRLWGSGDCMRELAGCKWLERLETLDLTANALENAHLRVLARSQHLDGLRYLTLAHNSGVSNGAQLGAFRHQQNRGLIIAF